RRTSGPARPSVRPLLTRSIFWMAVDKRYHPIKSADSSMRACDTTTAVAGAVQPIARNLRRWRTTREMTLSALAEQAGVAKSTVSLIERGQGNPSIDTVWALASALGVPFTALFHDEPPADDVSVVREDEGSVIAVDNAGLDAEGLVARHLLTRTGGALIEIYTLVLDEGAVRHAKPHVAGLFE